MKTLLFTTFLLISSFLYSSAQSSVYKVTGNGTKLYLGGSIHLLRQQDYPLPKEFDKAFSTSQALVLETDINEINKPDRARILLGYTMLPNEVSLKTLLSEDVYSDLETACSDAGIQLSQMDKFKPIMPILALTMVELGKMGVTQTGVDKFYLQKAQEQNKNLMFLEDVDFQLKLIANMADGNEDAFVKHSLDDLKQNTEMFEEMVKCWRNGTATELENQIADFKTDFPQLYEKLLVDRNNNWLPKLQHYLDTEETELVVVGALHLYGEDGLLQKLDDKGYKVEQLK